jgi:hypothetical protein
VPCWPRTLSKPGRPACEHSCMATSKASSKAPGPATERLAYLLLMWMLMTTRLLSPKRGCCKEISATSHEIFFVDLWAMRSTSCDKQLPSTTVVACGHCLASHSRTQYAFEVMLAVVAPALPAIRDVFGGPAQ